MPHPFGTFPSARVERTPCLFCHADQRASFLQVQECPRSSTATFALVPGSCTFPYHRKRQGQVSRLPWPRHKPSRTEPTAPVRVDECAAGVLVMPPTLALAGARQHATNRKWKWYGKAAIPTANG